MTGNIFPLSGDSKAKTAADCRNKIIAKIPLLAAY
jgi:hypothetical protein